MPFNTVFEGRNNPAWLEEPNRRIAERAEALSGENYFGYPQNLSRRAPFLNPDLTQSYQMGRDNTSDYLPYMQRAGQFSEAGAQEFPDNVDRYMNPYNQRVAQGMADLSGQAYREQFLPALEKQFVAAGQHGSTRHQELAQRGARDQQEVLNRQIGQLLHEGYGQAGKMFNVDSARKLEASGQQMEAGRGTQAGRIADMAALESQGKEQRAYDQGGKDIAYQDWMRQKNHPYEQLAFQSGIMHGMPGSTSVYRTEQTPGTAQLNTVGQLGTLATNILGARMSGGFGRKAGGVIRKPSVKKPMGLSKLKLSEGTFARKPKVGGSKGFKNMKNKDRRVL